MARNLSQMLPAGWGGYSPARKIDWFNSVGATVSELETAGVPRSDIDYMIANGFQPGATEKDSVVEDHIAELFRTYLGREPDLEGGNFYERQFGNEVDRDELSRFLYGAVGAGEITQRQASEFLNPVVKEVQGKEVAITPDVQERIDLYNEYADDGLTNAEILAKAEELFGEQTQEDFNILRDLALQDRVNEQFGGVTKENINDVVKAATDLGLNTEQIAAALGGTVTTAGEQKTLNLNAGQVGKTVAASFSPEEIREYIAATYGRLTQDNINDLIKETTERNIPLEDVVSAIGGKFVTGSDGKQSIQFTPNAALTAFQQAEDQIAQLYRQEFGRAPDAGGLNFYAAQLAEGRSLADIQAEIDASEEGARFDTQLQQLINTQYGGFGGANSQEIVNELAGKGYSLTQIADAIGADITTNEKGETTMSYTPPPPPPKTFTNEQVQKLITDQFGSVTPDNFQNVVDAVIGAGVPVDQFASVVGATISTNDAGQTSLTLPAAEQPKSAAPAEPINAQELDTANRGQPNETAAANLQQQLAAQTAAYKVTHNASFSRDQDKIVADMAKQLSRFGVEDLSDVVQGTRIIQEPIYDPNYYGDGSADIIGYRDVSESVVVNKRTGKVIPMNELNNSAGSGFTWYNMQFVNGVPVFYASKEETGWNAFKQEQLPAILQFAKFIPGVTPFAIAAEAALKLDEGMELDEVFKDTVDSIAKAELSTFLQNVVGAQFPELGLPADAPSMFEARYYDQLGNLFSAEEITAIKDYADPQNQQGGFYGNTKTAEYDPKTGVTKFYDSTGVNQIGEMGADGIYRSLVTGNQAPIASPSPATASTGQQTITVTGAQSPAGGITSLPTGGTKTDATVSVTGKKTDEPTTTLPVTAKVGTTTTTKGDVTVVGERTTDDGYRDEGESGTATFLVSDPSGLNTTNRETVKNEVLVTGEKEKTGVTGTTGTTKGPLSTGTTKITEGKFTELTADEIEALLKAGFTASLLLGGGTDSPTIPTTNVDIEGINTRRTGFTPDLTPTIPPGSTTTTTTTPGQTVYTNLGINTGKPTSPTTPTTGIGSLPVPTYKPPPFLGAQAPGASRVTPPVLTADPTFTQADFTAAAKDIATQQAALPPIVQVAPSSPFESGLAKGTTVAKRAGGIVALRGGGIPLFQMGGPVAFAYGGMTAPVNEPRMLSGGGDGMSDSIPATINGTQPARLADGEFVIPADVVSDIGNGSSKAGAKELYAMMDRVRQSRHGTTKQPPEVNMDKVLPV